MRIAAAIATFAVAWLVAMFLAWLLDAGLVGGFIIGCACGGAASKAFYWAYGDKR